MTIPSWVLVTLASLAVLFFYFLMFLLPDDAYGEEDARVFSEEKIRSRNRTQILVLGDIGRSPRMQNHALSIARHAIAVDIIGYVESELHPEFSKHKYLKVHQISKPPRFLQTDNRLLFLLYGPLKVILQFWELWMILGHQTKPAKWLIVQNPPSIPTLVVASMMSWLRKTRLIIDWHNYGYSILTLKLGANHPMVKLSWHYERYFARSASVNFTVSDAMRRQLKREFDITAPLLRLHDRPTSDFRPAATKEKMEFLADLLADLELPEPQQALLEEGKLKVLVSSTSWTPDEDFSILLDALASYSELATTTHPQLPELLVIITGKGPQKEKYMKKIDAMEKKGDLEMVLIKTAWFSTPVYAMLLASADLGVSLHKSSSGVDLPMKVVDMFGAGLPVAGWGMYESWPELVKEGINGRGFGSTEELKSILLQLLGDDGTKLRALRLGVADEAKNRWDDEWNSSAGKILGLVE